jgi:hypothetical protein
MWGMLCVGKQDHHMITLHLATLPANPQAGRCIAEGACVWLSLLLFSISLFICNGISRSR